MEKININNYDLIYEKSPDSPRIGFALYFSINEAEKYAGIQSLITKLLFQGTKNRTSNELAQELDINGIELSIESKQDFMRFKMLFLNEDIEQALDILEDIINNSTFEDFEKEVYKFKGEIESEMDSLRVRTVDNFVSKIFEGHYYGGSYTNVLKSLDKITKEDVLGTWRRIFNNSEKVMAVSGDIELKKLKTILSDRFLNLKSEKRKNKIPEVKKLEGSIISNIQKDDAKQAHIYQGWIVETLTSKDYPSFIVLNNLLGSSGLSSRLFVELRDKMGLAYVVRSSYEPLLLSAVFSIYIATSPDNIQKSLDGFKVEIEKVKNVLVGDDELNAAKTNVSGKFLYFTQTNLQRASLAAYNEIMGLGFDFARKYEQMIKNVTAEDIQRIARKYLNDDYVVSVLSAKKAI